MDIVDAQIHLGPVGRGFGPGPLDVPATIIDSTLEGMNSLGIRGAIIDEYWYWVTPPKPKQHMPGGELPNGAWRAVFPLAQLAAMLHPDRFCAFVRIDRRDPELESVMRVLATTPGVKAFRVLATWTPDEARAFVDGGYDAMFEIARPLGLPLCMGIPGFVEYLPRYARRYPDLQFVVDHWGMGIALNSAERPEAAFRRAMSIDYLDEIMKLADCPNVSLKIGHAHMYFRSHVYPFPEVRPHLRRAIAAFGAERLIWASDKTMSHPPLSWADLLYSLREDPELSGEEKELILGRNARRIFRWPSMA